MNFCCNYFVNSKQKTLQNFYGQLKEKRPFFYTFGLGENFLPENKAAEAYEKVEKLWPLAKA